MHQETKSGVCKAVYLSNAGMLIQNVDGYFCSNPGCDTKIGHHYFGKTCNECDSQTFINAICKIDLTKIKGTL